MRVFANNSRLEINVRRPRYYSIILIAVVGVQYFFSLCPVHTAQGGNAVVAAAAGCPWSCIASHIPALAHRRRVPAGHVL